MVYAGHVLALSQRDVPAGAQKASAGKFIGIRDANPASSVRFRHPAVQNRTPEEWNLDHPASVYLLGIQLLGLFSRFGH
jgi:hypothetical protein